MSIAPLPLYEETRLSLLHRLSLLDTPAEETFDRITRIASKLLEVPIALVSLVDADRQWFKSKVGLDVCETSREYAFCAHALGERDLLIVPDARADDRFAENPLVLGAPSIRFYAGAPLRSASGHTLGTLCIIDTVPRDLSASAIAILRDLAAIVQRELLLRETANAARAVQEDDRRALALSESRFTTVFLQTPTGKAILDLNGQFLEVNPRLCEITGYHAAELREKTFMDITDESFLASDYSVIQDLLVGVRQSISLEKRYRRKDGVLVWVSVSIALVRDADGRPSHSISVTQDINSRKESEAAVLGYQTELERRVAQRTDELLSSRETLRAITDNLPILIARVDTDLCYRFNNEVYRTVFGVDPASLGGKHFSDVLSPQLYLDLLPYFKRALAGERVTNDHVCYEETNGAVWSVTYIPDVRGDTVVGFYVMSQDVTERKRAEQLLRESAMRDSLTQLPNRRALHIRLSEATEESDHENVHFAVFFLDLDGFKAVNDSYGHDAGDVVLRQVAERLCATVRKQDFVSRLAGDEFVVLATGMQQVSACTRVAQDICRALAKPFRIGARSLTLGASVGIAMRAPDGISAERLLSEADSAMYEAKRKGRNGYRFAGTISDLLPRQS